MSASPRHLFVGAGTVLAVAASPAGCRQKVFTDAVRAGGVAAAKKAYAGSRIGWERTEPAKDWTGWHRLEKALWQDNRIGDRDKQFAATNTVLDKYRTDNTSYVFTSYEKVGKEQRKELSDRVNTLAEPLSKLARRG